MVKRVIIKKASRKVGKTDAKAVSKKVSKKKTLNERTEDSMREAKFGKLASFKWTEKLSVGEPTIDAQHKKILGQVNDLQKKMVGDEGLKAIRECIHFLDGYIKEHFSYEEQYMEEKGYPGLEKHREIHQKFIQFYEGFKKEFSLKLRKSVDARGLVQEYAKKVHDFLGDWVIQHIDKEDHLYADYIEDHPIKNGNVKTSVKVEKEDKGIDVSKIAQEIKAEQISEQREPVSSVPNLDGKKIRKNFIMTGVSGFDDLLKKGIPKGNTILVAGGAGSGKTIFCLQALMNKVIEGKKCLYMSFEEREERLIGHMKDFGWDPEKYIKKGNFKIQRINPFDITRNVDALLAKQKGELLIDVDPVIIPGDFKPDFIALDSLTAIASAFTGKEENYRIYIEQLFRFFEKIGATSFLITETEQIPKIFSKTGVEEFLADGVVVFYNLKHGNVRENAIEILKLRGAAHEKRIVAMQITDKGIVVYPEQEVFSEIEGD